MKNGAFAVIGANYGDEGKGLATDYLTRKLTNYSIPIVARGNGGAQAGHTVQTKAGQRHVFGHIGAGTFCDADTYLAQNFILNPYVFEKEVEALDYDTSKISGHAGCKVTTIYDMALNSLREIARGDSRHGSCGLGINETVNRHKAGYEITLVDVHTMSNFAMGSKLKHIYFSYWLKEFDKLKGQVDVIRAKPFLDIFLDRNFVRDAGKLEPLKQIRMAHPYDTPAFNKCLVVEGAQGLALDEKLGEFPHVTRSITGLPSAILAAFELGYAQITPLYVTRSYLTRHGAGPLQNEGGNITNKDIPVDKTNVHGEWQGSFRYAPLDIFKLGDLIAKDLYRAKMTADLLGITINKPQMMITCMDQIGDKLMINSLRGLDEICSKELPRIIERDVNVEVRYMSYGPTAHDVVEYE